MTHERTMTHPRLEITISEFIVHALAVAAMGIQVFPLQPLGVTPAVDDWGDVATTDPDQIRDWWAANPGSNVGIATGERSNLFVVEIDGSDGLAWYRSIGMPESDAIVKAPTMPQRTYHYFRPAGFEVLNSEPHPGVKVHGERSYVPGPGSMTVTGTYRGDITSIPVADFDPATDLAVGGNSRRILLIDLMGLLPEFTSTKLSFLDLVLLRGDIANLPPRTTRVLLMAGALSAGLSRQQAGSLALGSIAGRGLPDGGDGLQHVLAELDEDGPAMVPLHLGESPQAQPLLDESERALASTSAWWGSRYADWAASLTGGKGGALHRANGWILLSAMFAADTSISSGGVSMSADVRVAVVGNGAALASAREPMNALLQSLSSGLELSAAQLTDTAHSASAGVLEGSRDDAEGAIDRLGTNVMWAIGDLEQAESGFLDESPRDLSAPTPLGSMPGRLAAEFEDAKDRLLATHGEPPFSVWVDKEALERHTALKADLEKVLMNRGQLSDFANEIGKCAALVALSEGVTVVTVEHELIALLHAEEWLGNLLWLKHNATVHANA